MGSPLVLAIIAVLAVGEFLLFGALAEAYRDIRQLREQTGALDVAMPIDLGAARGAVPSRFGLHEELDSAVRAVVIFLESRCGTCRLIVNSLNGGIPKGMWLVVIAESPAAAIEWLTGAGFEESTLESDRVMVVSAEDMDQHLGVTVTPMALEIEHGQLVRAKSIPSVRQFYNTVPTTFRLAPATLNEEAHA
jgi:hypothetical protein